MDNTPFLQAEDKLDYTRLLEELLHNEQVRAAQRRAPTGPNIEQLHTRALAAFPEISATAAAEYAYFVQLREQARKVAEVPATDRGSGDDPTQWQAPENPFAAAERAGWVPLIAVLLPIFSGLSGIVLLLFGWALQASDKKLGHPLVSAGLVALVICTASICGDIIGLLLTANRDSHAPPNGRNPELYAELAKARETWHSALRDRGLLPYLLGQLGAVPRPPGPRPTGVSLVRARPRLGFSSPGFTSPGAERLSNVQGEPVEPQENEVHFSSPGYTSPGPEGFTDERGEEIEPSAEEEPHFTSPGYSSPGYVSPRFTVPPQKPETRARPETRAAQVPATALEPEAQPPAPRAANSRFLRNDDDEDADLDGGRR